MSAGAGARADGHTLEHLAGSGPAGAAPMLFVHGAFATPWVWQRHFMPWFAGRGHDVYAMSLRGAGPRRDGYPEPGLGDYLEDLEAAVRSIGERVVVVAHSLGALVAQMALGRVPMAGLALLAPVPATGMYWSSMRLAVRSPDLWARTVLGVAEAGFASTASTRAALFTDDTDDAIVDETHRNLRHQPARPLMEAQWPRHVPRAGRLELPVLTVAGGQDRLIPGDVVERTARYHDGTHLTLDRSAHAMMLDEHWRDAAGGIADWMATATA